MVAKKVECKNCEGLCCRYIALPLENPEDRQDFDDIRWYLCHENTSVFVEDGEWYINIRNKCKHLGKNNKCGIYDKRPKICRRYDTEDCELAGEEYDYELHFTNDKQMEEYINIKFDNNKSDHPSNDNKSKSKAKAKKK